MNFLGADVGGTHTDLVLVDGATGALHFEKLLSTPGSATSVVDGIQRLGRSSGAGPVDLFVHGCTIATNAYLTRSGARLALVVTEGFRDVLEIRDQLRPHLYRLKQTKPPALASRNAVVEARERIDAFGRVVTPLVDPDGVADEVARLKPDAVAICLTFSHLNDSHEVALVDALEERLPGVPIYRSSLVNPEIEEYPRAHTTALAAYVGPVVERYLTDLEKRLAAIEMNGALLYMRSDGGAATAAAIRENPAHMLLSGPAGGIIAGAALAASVGVGDIVTFDMGGTSADFSIIVDGRPATTGARLLDGQPVRLPMIDIETISAGGGSIARVDKGGGLCVGPDSAGASPGPACYGKGGNAATVTDAMLVLGIMDAADYLGGAVKLDRSLAVEAIRRTIADPLAIGVDEAAFGILALANANMSEAIRTLSTERGQDIRRFALLAFGGAGPISASYIARDLGMAEVLVPPNPGVFCALGMLMTDLRHTMQRPFRHTLNEINGAEFARALAEMSAEIDERLARDGVPDDDRYYTLWAGCRCVGQFHELPVEIRYDRTTTAWDPTQIATSFHALHRERYGHSDPSVPVECVNLRFEGCGKLARPSFPRLTSATEANPTPTTRRQVKLERSGGPVDCPIYDRDRLRAGHVFDGPAIIRQRDATTVILAGQTVTVTEQGVMRVRAKETRP